MEDLDLIPITKKFWKSYPDDLTLIFDETKSPHPVYILSKVSSSIWRLCDGTRPIRDIVNSISATYHISRDQAEQDVMNFLSQLEKKQLISWTNKAAEGFQVLLIDPPAVDPEVLGEPKEPSLGLAYLAAVLSTENVSTKVLDLRQLPLHWQELLNRVLQQDNPQVVGITCLSPTFPTATHIAFHIRQALPETTIVFGGHHATFTFKDVLKQNPWIDVVVIGEGEETMRELTLALREGKDMNESIKGLAFRRNGTVVVSPKREFITNLDALPFPDPCAITINTPSYTTARILSSRGCPFSCRFCSEAGFYHRTIRYRSAENVVNEIEYKYNTYGFHQFLFSDDLFVVDLERVKRICAEIQRRHLPIEWGCNTRVDTAPRGIFEMMRDSGCQKIFVGVESGSPQILHRMNKRSRVESIKAGIRMVKDIGIKVSAGFIIGFPEESQDTIRNSIQLAKELDLDEVTFTFLNVYPGTDLYYHFNEYGLRFVTGRVEYSVYKPVIETEEFRATDAMEAYLDMCHELPRPG